MLIVCRQGAFVQIVARLAFRYFLQMADSHSAENLVTVLYSELRRLAARSHWRYGAGETMRSTVLVSETFLKLRAAPDFQDERHFLRTAALAMRQILVNHARARLTAKRGGGASVPLDDDLPVFWESDERLVALDDALGQLALVNQRLVDIVEYRFFGGFSEAETGELLGINERTVRREWAKAKALLLDHMQDA